MWSIAVLSDPFVGIVPNVHPSERTVVVELVKALERDIGKQDTRSTVKRLLAVNQAIRDLSRRKIYPNIRGARLRILEYFKENLGTVIDSEELAVVSGIQDFPRRVRELRVEHGWPIISGVGVNQIQEDDDGQGITQGDNPLPSMRPDQYVLIGATQDANSAHRWRTANEIRRQDAGTKEKLLNFFLANVGAEVGIEELRYVANDSGDWPRRTRELRTEDGWPIVTRFSGDPTMQVGTYKLAEDRQLPAHDRFVPEIVRRNVMKRDGGKCQWLDCGWPIGFPDTDHRFLEVHHIVFHADGGTNTAENLVTLCNLHHDEVHRTGELAVFVKR